MISFLQGLAPWTRVFGLISDIYKEMNTRRREDVELGLLQAQQQQLQETEEKFSALLQESKNNHHSFKLGSGIFYSVGGAAIAGTGTYLNLTQASQTANSYLGVANFEEIIADGGLTLISAIFLLALNDKCHYAGRYLEMMFLIVIALMSSALIIDGGNRASNSSGNVLSFMYGLIAIGTLLLISSLGSMIESYRHFKHKDVLEERLTDTKTAAAEIKKKIDVKQAHRPTCVLL